MSQEPAACDDGEDRDGQLLVVDEKADEFLEDEDG